MPVPGLIGAAAGMLARKGVGGLLKKGAGRVVGKVIGAVRGGTAKKAAKIIAKTAAGGAVFEAGSRAVSRGSSADDGERRRYRRTNVGNIKALRRAMRRVEGFAKLAKSTITFTKSTRMKSRGKRR